MVTTSTSDRGDAPGAVPRRHCDLVVIAASSGGIAAVSEIIGALPADFQVPIAIVQHRPVSVPMPLSAIKTGDVDHIVPLAAIAPLLLRLVGHAGREGVGR